MQNYHLVFKLQDVCVSSQKSSISSEVIGTDGAVHSPAQIHMSSMNKMMACELELHVKIHYRSAHDRHLLA